MHSGLSQAYICCMLLPSEWKQYLRLLRTEFQIGLSALIESSDRKKAPTVRLSKQPAASVNNGNIAMTCYTSAVASNSSSSTSRVRLTFINSYYI